MSRDGASEVVGEWAGADAGAVAESGAGAGAVAESGAGAGAVAESGAGAVAESGAGAGAAAEPGAGAGAVAESGAGGGAEAVAESDTDGAMDRFEHLHRRLKRIVKARGVLDAQEAAALREAQSTKMWRHYGCSSLIDYMEREMGYTARAAIERLRVANAIEELPVIAEAMDQGSLSFSGARELTRIVTPETQEAWLDAAVDKSSRQIEEMVRGHKPGDLPTNGPILRCAPRSCDLR